MIIVPRTANEWSQAPAGRHEARRRKVPPRWGLEQISLDIACYKHVAPPGLWLLMEWHQIGSITNVTGTAQYTDPAATNHNRCFYRFVMP